MFISLSITYIKKNNNKKNTIILLFEILYNIQPSVFDYRVIFTYNLWLWFSKIIGFTIEHKTLPSSC